MKEKGHDHVELTEEPEEEGVDNTPHAPRNLDGKGRVKWYELIDYDKIIPHLPILKNIRGSKAKIQLWMFSEIDSLCQSIFEKNKPSFRYRAQVDILCYYLGAKLMEQIYVVRTGHSRSKLCELLELREEDNMVFDDMKTVKEKFKADVEKYYEGFLTKEEIYVLWESYLSVFSFTKDKEKMNKVLNNMVDSEGHEKVKDRLRKRHERERDKFHIVGD